MIRTVCLSLVVIASLASIALADDPSITQFSPPGFARGEETTLEISGVRIGDATQLLLYDSGVDVVSVEAVDDKKTVAKLRIAPDCPPGLHAVRLATRTGISNLRYFGVSALKQASESEPNSLFDEPQPLELNTTVNGVITNEDVDYFALDLKEGQKVTIELEGLRLGTEFFDPFVAILDANRFELARSDDSPLVQQDCVCSYIAKTAGRYIVEVRESSFGGNGRCQYRMHVGDFPRPVSIVPAGGKPGEKILATVVDASGETWQQEIQLPSQVGDFPYIAERNGQYAPSPNMLRVVEMANVMETEPDPDRKQLIASETPIAFNGVLQTADDVDWFKFNGKKDQLIDVVVYGRRLLRSPVDSWLEIHKATGGRVAVNDDSGGPDSQLERFKLPEDGEYLISIRDQLNEGSLEHAYRIEVSQPEPQLRLSIGELTSYFSQTVEIPRGSQMSVLLTASRKNFGGELALQLLDPPEGVTIEMPTVPASASSIPLLIKASPDAPIDARLSTLVAATTLPDKPVIRGELEQRTMLVRGQNNRDMWGHQTNRLAIAVTESLPFSIEVEQPKVPIVRGGAAHFVVRAKRDEGFKERIYLQAVFNPSGVSTSRSIRIEGDQTEATIPITANGNAAIGSFPTAILARAKARDALVWVSSPMVNLDIEDSYFDLKFVKSVIEAGQSGAIALGVEAKLPPAGEVGFEIVGLPNGITCVTPRVKWDLETATVNFPVEVAATAQVAPHKTLNVKAYIIRPEGVIEQTAGTGEIQVTAAVTQIAAAEKPKSVEPAAPAAKPLSRLEQLRQAKQGGGL